MRSIQSASRRILGPVFTLEIAAKRPRSRTRSGARSALFEQLRLNREMEQMFAKGEARRQRRAEKQ
jgi:hypothetical protein